MCYFNVAKFRRNRTNPTRCKSRFRRDQTFLATESSGKKHHAKPVAHKVTLTRNGQEFTVNNPTPYTSFSVMPAHRKMAIRQPVSPNSDVAENLCTAECEDGECAVLTYVNDYGARMPLFFTCNGTVARLMKSRAAKAEAGSVR